MTIEEAKKLGLCLFDIDGITPWIRVTGDNSHAIELLFEGERYIIKKSSY